jgi:hypothetical protein
MDIAGEPRNLSEARVASKHEGEPPSPKRGPGRPKSADRRGSIVVLKGLPEYKAWLDALAEHCDRTVAGTMADALAHYADSRGFRSPPRR